jgi:hypothetical protein
MKVAYLKRAGSVALLCVVVLISGVSSQANGQACSKKKNYKRLNYTIREVRIDDPWAFLHFAAKTGGANEAVERLKGRRYDFKEIDAAFKLVENERISDADFSYSSIGLENCSAADRQLDVVFKIFAVRISPLLSSTFEFHQSEKEKPAEAAGVSTSKRFRFIPNGGYDETNKGFGGGKVAMKLGSGAVENFSLAGVAGPEMGLGEGSLNGSFDSATRIISRAEWQLDYQYASLPTDRTRLKTGRILLLGSGMTRPLKGAVFRFGGQMEGGNQQSTFNANDLGARVLSSAGYSSLKLYVGLTAHPRRHAIAASYGLELGSTESGFHGLAQAYWRPRLRFLGTGGRSPHS